MNWFALVCVLSTPLCFWLSHKIFDRGGGGWPKQQWETFPKADFPGWEYKPIGVNGAVLWDTDGRPVVLPKNTGAMSAEGERHWRGLSAELEALDERIGTLLADYRRAQEIQRLLGQEDLSVRDPSPVVKTLMDRRKAVWEQARALVDRAEVGQRANGDVVGPLTQLVDVLSTKMPQVTSIMDSIYSGVTGRPAVSIQGLGMIHTSLGMNGVVAEAAAAVEIDMCQRVGQGGGQPKGWEAVDALKLAGGDMGGLCDEHGALLPPEVVLPVIGELRR